MVCGCIRQYCGRGLVVPVVVLWLVVVPNMRTAVQPVQVEVVVVEVVVVVVVEDEDEEAVVVMEGRLLVSVNLYSSYDV